MPVHVCWHDVKRKTYNACGEKAMSEQKNKKKKTNTHRRRSNGPCSAVALLFGDLLALFVMAINYMAGNDDLSASALFVPFFSPFTCRCAINCHLRFASTLFMLNFLHAIFILNWRSSMMRMSY